MKQYTTPTIPITVPVSLDKVDKIEFIFKKLVDSCVNKDKYKTYPTLLHKVFKSDQIRTTETNGAEGFEMLLSLTAEETMKMPCGQVLMDTLLVLTDGQIPEIELEVFEMNPTLFKEADAGAKN